jgi:pimeloyl-ACP methyl ester carboxylesterase
MGDAMTGPAVLKHVRTPTLEIAYEESGPGNGIPVILLHGFPYDPRAYDVVVPPLVNAGCRTIVPYLRGFGPTRFLVGDVPRSGQQAALGQDLVGLLDALALPRAVLVGYDWGGRAACIAAALWPERVRGLVSIGGYNIQDIAGSVAPQSPEQEYRYWYQYYFQTERGRAGLHAHRRELCRLLWRLWSPHWQFDYVAYDRTAASFNNPDFVEVVIHSYRHRFGSVPGDPALEAIEQRLAAQPPIRVPTIVLHGGGDGVTPPEASAEHARHFTGPFERRVIPMAGHNLPQEVPGPVVEAVRALLAG